MRIKSYFAPSVQAAIALARKEFGDNVTLVTSHVASLDNRHLGDYEVVFAIEENMEESLPAPPPEQEPEAKPESEPELETKAEAPLVEPAPAPAFTDFLQQALLAPAPMHQDLPEKLEQIHSSLIALGLEASVAKAFMTMLKAVLPAIPEAPALAVEVAENIVEAIEVEAMEDPVAVLPIVLPIQEPAGIPVAQALAAVEVPGDLPVLLPAVAMVEALPAPEPKIVPPPPLPAPRPFLALFEAAPRPQQPRFSAAELAFMSSVSPSKEQGGA